MPSQRRRLRITFVKGDAIRYCSHLDLIRAWVRSLRRARMPLAYSQGFTPRPRLQLASALPLGHTGGAELLDVWLESAVDHVDLAERLPASLPVGLAAREVREVPTTDPALQTRVASAVYRVTLEWDEPAGLVEARIARLLESAELTTERRGQQYDLRPLVERLWLEGAGEGQVVLGMQVAARPGETARPDAVVEVLGMGGTFSRYHRDHLVLVAD